MTKYTQRVTQIIIAPDGAPIFAESATTVAIDDEAAGEFVTVKQDNGCAAGTIKRNITKNWALRNNVCKPINQVKP